MSFLLSNLMFVDSSLCDRVVMEWIVQLIFFYIITIRPQKKPITDLIKKVISFPYAQGH